MILKNLIQHHNEVGRNNHIKEIIIELKHIKIIINILILDNNLNQKFIELKHLNIREIKLLINSKKESLLHRHKEPKE